MDDDIDLDDLLGEEGSGMSDTLRQPLGTVINPAHIPTDRELQLAKRVRQLEDEKQTLHEELRLLRAQALPAAPDYPKPPTLSTTPLAESNPISIPPELLPVLSLFKQHIADLTAENAALRYTFMGEVSQAVTGSEERGSGPDIEAGPVSGLKRVTIEGADQVRLEDVVSRVRHLVKENEELGEMVMSLGRTHADEYERIIAESKAVIESLDADLTVHLNTITSLRDQLAETAATGNRSQSEVTVTPTPGLGTDPRHAVGSSASAASASTPNNASISSHKSSSTSGPTNLSIRGAHQSAQSHRTPLVRPGHAHRTSISNNRQAINDNHTPVYGHDRDKRRERDVDRESQGSGSVGGSSQGGISRGGFGHRQGQGQARSSVSGPDPTARHGSRGAASHQQGEGRLDTGIKEPPRGPRDTKRRK